MLFHKTTDNHIFFSVRRFPFIATVAVLAAENLVFAVFINPLIIHADRFVPMRKIILLLIAGSLWAAANGQNKNADSILNMVLKPQFCFRTADEELDILSKTYQLKFNYDRNRMSKYDVSFDINNDKLVKVLKLFCKATDSKYFIGNDNTIYFFSMYDKSTPQLTGAIQDAVQQQMEQVRTTPVEQPKKFNISVSGKITDRNSGESLPNVSISIRGTNAGATSNVDGYFTLYDVPNDTAVLQFSNVGYLVSNVFLSPDKRMDSLQVEMVTLKSTLGEVVVYSRRPQSFKLNQKVSMIKMTPALIENLPSIGEKDVFRAFQLMPGISAANENSSGLYVRGGTPDQTLVLYDGFTVYNAEHMFGFFSAFNSNAIKDISLYKGGFESKYGGRLSSVVDINSKEGNSKGFKGGADLSMMSVNLYGDGPVGKDMVGILTFRKSFKTGLYNKLFQKYNSQSSAGNNRNFRRGPFGNGQDTKSYFYDVNGKITWKPNSKDVISLSIYNGQDNLDNSITPKLPSFLGGSGRSLGIDITDVTDWGNTGASLRWSRRLNPKLFLNSMVSFSTYFSSRERSTKRTTASSAGDTETKNGTFENNNLVDYSAKSDIEYKLSNVHTLEAGIMFTYNGIRYSYAQNDTTKIIDRNTTGATTSVYLQDKINLMENKLQLIPGLRTTYFGPTGKPYLEPRLNVSYDVTEKIKLKASVGNYYQFAKRVVREDVLQGSKDFWTLADGKLLPIASSWQFIAGASWENDDWLVDIEGYYKKLKSLSEYSLRFQIRPGVVNYSENFFEGTGYAAGIDFLVQKKFGDYTGWVGYTYGKAVNNYPVYGATDFYASNDVRHEFKTVHMYKWQKFDFGLTFIFATGRPYTAPVGAYSVTLLDGSEKDIINVGAKNGSRLPAYHRLDLSATYNFGKLGNGHGSIGISFFNVYNRANVWYKNYEIVDNVVISTDVNYLPFTPNLTFTYKFR